MYEDIEFQEGINLEAIPKYNYRPENITAIGKFDFRGIKGSIYGKASSPYTTIELYAPKEWFKEKPDFGYRMRGEGIGPYRLEPDKEYYRLPDAGLYNDAFYKAAASEEAANEMIYESMANVLQEYIPQIFEEKLKISTKDQADKLTVYVVSDYKEILDNIDDIYAEEYHAPSKIFRNRDEAEKYFKEIFDSCKDEEENVVFAESEDNGEKIEGVTYEEASKKGEFYYYNEEEGYYGFAKISRHELVLSKEQQNKEDINIYLLDDVTQLPGDSETKVFASEAEALKAYKEISNNWRDEDYVINGRIGFTWGNEDNCGICLLREKNIKLMARKRPSEKLKKGLLMEDLRKHKPVDIIKKGKLQYEDFSQLGEYYYKLAELKDNELIPQYDKDREIIKEMIHDGLKDARIRVVFMNIEDRRNIPHQNHVAAILKEPTIKQFKTMIRQKSRTMQKQR